MERKVNKFDYQNFKELDLVTELINLLENFRKQRDKYLTGDIETIQTYLPKSSIDEINNLTKTNLSNVLKKYNLQFSEVNIKNKEIFNLNQLLPFYFIIINKLIPEDLKNNQDLIDIIKSCITIYKGQTLEKYRIKNPTLTININKLRNLLLQKRYRIDIIHNLINSFLNIKQKNLGEFDVELIKNKNDKLEYINIFFKKVNIETLNYCTEFLNNIKNKKAILETTYTFKKVIIDYSSPNVAKQMSVGHLRSTVIGNVIGKLLELGGANVFKWNYLGDWGEQFGKIFYVLLKVDDEKFNYYKKLLKSNPNKALLEIYVEFKKIEDTNKEKIKKNLFYKLVNGDNFLKKLWEKIRKISLKDFETIYNRFNINFDTYLGESFSNEIVDLIIKKIPDKYLFKDSTGNIYIKFGIDKNGNYVLLSKDSNPDDQILYTFNRVLINNKGATNYLTRDIAVMIYRFDYMGADEVIYVVGQEQKDHFKMLKAVAKKLYPNKNVVHIPFGLYLVKNKKGKFKKMSSREGNVIKLNELLQVVDNEVAKIFTNLTYEQIKIISNLVLLIFELRNDYQKDIKFDQFYFKDILNTEGIYILKTYYKWRSIYEKTLLKVSMVNIDTITYDYNIINIFNHFIKFYIQFVNAIFKGIEDKDIYVIIDLFIDISKYLNNLYINLNIKSLDDKYKTILKPIVESYLYMYEILFEILGVDINKLPKKI